MGWMMTNESQQHPGVHPEPDERVGAATDNNADGNDFPQQFSDAMNADLNTPAALAVIFDAMTWSRNHPDVSLTTFIDMVRRTFGCFDPEEKESIPAEVQTLLDERAAARAAKNFAESDRLRDEIAKRGFEVKDMKDGQQMRKL